MQATEFPTTLCFAHGPDEVAGIAAKITEFGWTVPVLVADDGEVIPDHVRILAAAELGLTEAPVIVLDHLTEAQRRAYRIADNRLTELGGLRRALLSVEPKDLLADEVDLSLTGIEDGELHRLLREVEGGGGGAGSGGGVPTVVVPEPPRNRSRERATSGSLRPPPGLRRQHASRGCPSAETGKRVTLFATDPPLTRRTTAA